VPSEGVSDCLFLCVSVGRWMNLQELVDDKSRVHCRLVAIIESLDTDMVGSRDD
jgi:hypothetical protein